MVWNLLLQPDFVLTDIVFDLPRLRQKPSYDKLYQVINSLSAQLPSWDGSSQSYVETSQDTEAISRYLTAIIGSDLEWLSNESTPESEAAKQRDTLWELASKRLAERCGRTGKSEASSSEEMFLYFFS